MAKAASLDLEVLDVKAMILSGNPTTGAMLTVEIVGDQIVNLYLSPLALAKVEAYLARASAMQAKHQPIQ